MGTWPVVDKELRRKLLGELRRRRNYDQAHLLTPEQRLEKLEGLRQLANAFEHSRPIKRSQADEPPELWLRLLRHWKRET
ncbi:MAG: hypothetical protein ACOZIN_17290 [Myxococcota bacterium]